MRSAQANVPNFSYYIFISISTLLPEPKAEPNSASETIETVRERGITRGDLTCRSRTRGEAVRFWAILGFLGFREGIGEGAVNWIVERRAARE